jgi:tetratricopeptide (TPR) repeat protein
MLGAYRALAATLYWSGDFESARQYATRGVQIWHLGNVQSIEQDQHASTVGCLCYAAMSEWQFGEIASAQANIAEAISLAKELNDTGALAHALSWAANLALYERDPAEVDRLASELIELSTRHNFAYWLAMGAIWRGWALSASGNTAEGIPWIEHGMRDYRATGSALEVAFHLIRKAEALYLADRIPEALEAINEAEALAERFEQRDCAVDLHRFRGVFLAAMGAEETQIKASFCEAIRIAKEQKSTWLQKRTEATCAEYRRQKTSGSGGCGFRLPLW